MPTYSMDSRPRDRVREKKNFEKKKLATEYVKKKKKPSNRVREKKKITYSVANFSSFFFTYFFFFQFFFSRTLLLKKKIKKFVSRTICFNLFRRRRRRLLCPNERFMPTYSMDSRPRDRAPIL